MKVEVVLEKTKKCKISHNVARFCVFGWLMTDKTRILFIRIGC